VRRWLLGLATLWPVIYIAFFFAVVATASIAGGGDPDNDLIIPEAVLFSLHIATMILIIVLLVVYIRAAYRNPELPDDRRTFWAVVLFMGNAIAMPIYWWLYMRPKGDAETNSGNAPEPAH
jgi:hypothetical protein